MTGSDRRTPPSGLAGAGVAVGSGPGRTSMKAGRRWGRLVALALVLSALPLGGAEAASSSGKAPAVELPQPLTRDAIRELVARLSDAEVRQLLLSQLDKAAAPEAKPEDAAMATGLASRFDHARDDLRAVLRAAPTLPAELGAAVGRFSEGRSPHHLLLVTTIFVGMLAIAGLVERLVGRLLADVRRRHEHGAGEVPGRDGVRLLIRVLLDLFLLTVFAATIVATFLAVYQGHEPSRELIVSAFLAVIQARVAMLIARWLLAPQAPGQ